MGATASPELTKRQDRDLAEEKGGGQKKKTKKGNMQCTDVTDVAMEEETMRSMGDLTI